MNNNKYDAGSWEAFDESKVSVNKSQYEFEDATKSNSNSQLATKEKLTEQSVHNVDALINKNQKSNNAKEKVEQVISKAKEISDSDMADKIKETIPVVIKVVLGLVSLFGVILNIITGIFVAVDRSFWFDVPMVVIAFVPIPFFLINSIVLFKAKSKNAFIVSYILADILYLGLSIAALVLVLNY